MSRAPWDPDPRDPDAPVPTRVRPLGAAEQEIVRRRQRAGARAMGLLLGALAVLIFLITVAKQVKP